VESFVISGGLSGLGAELVKASWERGCRPVIVGRNVRRPVPESIRDIPVECVERGDYETTKNLLNEKIPAMCSQITVCLNAATIEPLGRLGDLDTAKIHQAVDVNYVWQVELVRQALTISESRAIPMRVILITSGAAAQAIKGWSIYCSTKAAIEHFIRCVALDYPAVPCLAIDPGLIDTPMQETLAAWRSIESDAKSLGGLLRSPCDVAQTVLDQTEFWG